MLPRLYAIVDVDVCARAGRDPVALASIYVASGVRLLQVRAKTLESGPLLTLAEAVVAVAHDAGAQVIINDRADIALMAGADGVHVGQDDLAPSDVRKVVGGDLVVGFSTHSVAQLEEALREPVSYVAVGPVFGTATKDTGYSAVGLELVAQAAGLAARRGIPVVAIGGIQRANVEAVWRAGAASAAVITDLIGDDPAARVAEFLAVERRLA